MKKIGKITAGFLLLSLVVLTIAITLIKSTVPDGLELREFIYLDCSTAINVLWMIVTICIVATVLRGIGKTDYKEEKSRFVSIIGMIIVTLTALLLIGIRIAINNYAANIEGKEFLNPDGTITVEKESLSDEVFTAVYVKEGFLYRKRIE
ncbi:hypothetical protein D6853_00825 [Butyrivibrio sp. X503]|uniref:hypothetical protein n=1 Tax=Butyrivibrio sp. X503 TaxID=2364878 RepID=UPI000EA98E24|nr:hypothetical protein [Butyrivibrio sp. X503]RKM58113.1 hypothetical protein D6853_00825 [Butyrivibrio sp. X503]